MGKDEDEVPRTRPAYPPELRAELLARVAAGESPEDLAERYEPSAQTIRNWVHAEQKQQVKGSDGRSLAELEAENRELRARLADAEESVVILKKAAAWFATETKTPPRRAR